VHFSVDDFDFDRLLTKSQDGESHEPASDQRILPNKKLTPPAGTGHASTIVLQGKMKPCTAINNTHHARSEKLNRLKHSSQALRLKGTPRTDYEGFFPQRVNVFVIRFGLESPLTNCSQNSKTENEISLAFAKERKQLKNVQRRVTSCSKMACQRIRQIDAAANSITCTTKRK